MTHTNTAVTTKVAAAFVATAMLLMMVAPAKAATIEELQAMIAQLTAQLAALSGSTTTGASMYTFTRSLTVGSQGVDVTALQNYLIGKGHSIPAGATGYFGAQTAAAVAQWQAANGVAPAAGYFGPVSQAKYNMMMATTGCTTTTGGTTSAGLSGGAGTASVTNYTSDVEDAVNTGDSENILGWKLEADDSDVRFTNVKMTFTYTGAQSTILNRYFVSHANGTIDSNDSATTWTVTGSDFRYTDGSGAILTTSPSGITNTGVNVIKLASSGDVKIKYSLASDNPDAQSVFVDDATSGELITLLKFRVKAEGTDAKFDTVSFTASSSAALSTMVSEFRLMRGSTVLQSTSTISASTGSSVVKFDLDDHEEINMDDTETYTLVAKMNTNTFTGSTIVANFTSTNVTDSNDDTIATARISGSAQGDIQTIRGDGVTLAKTSFTATDVQKSEAQVTASSTTSSDKEYAKFVLTFKVTADGDDIYVSSSTNGHDVVIHSLSGAALSTTTSLSSTADKDGNGNYRINDGETETFTFTVETATSTGTTTKLIASTFKFATSGASTTFTSSQAFTPVADWTSDAVILN